MKPHEQRVIDERDALGTKLNALVAFIVGAAQFIKLPPGDQALLRKQRNAMIAYYNILEHRISRFRAET